MRAARLGLICVLPALAACTALPALDDGQEASAARAEWPALMPIDGLLATVPPAPDSDPAAALMARAAALRARAAALQAAGASG